MTLAEKLELRERLTTQLDDSQYNAELYLERARCYDALRYPDLAAADAYKSLLLTDEAQSEESGEYYEQAVQALHHDTMPDDDEGMEQVQAKSTRIAAEAYELLAKSLIDVGCIRSAWDFIKRGLAISSDSAALKSAQGRIISSHGTSTTDGSSSNGDNAASIDPMDLPDKGTARREIYPWNSFEPDRNSPAFVAELNAQLAAVAPQLEARVTELPVLSADGATQEGSTSRQLGLFARARVAPGAQLLRERSILTGTYVEEGVCDACSGPIADLGAMASTTNSNSNDDTDDADDADDADNDGAGDLACPDCAEAAFCSPACRDQALALYHPALCDTGAGAIARDVPLAQSADALYLLLVVRAVALAQTQGLHPLALPQTTSLWGEFVEAPQQVQVQEQQEQEQVQTPPTATATLPWSFTFHVLEPIHVLETMDLDIFATRPLFDAWVVNTLFAKFRGVSSGSVNPRTGRPETCAVHPLWCLANHSCAPNVRWEWGGEIRFWARDGESVVRWGKEGEGEGEGGEEARWKGGLEKDEEVLSHYCDVGLKVKDRREWAMGALGGLCMCDRCRWEAGEV